MSFLFLSHSSADRAQAEELRAWLRGVGHEGVFFDVDPEDGVRAGEEWEARLYTELSRCRALVALVTPAWLRSAWCAAEASHAQARGKPVFPLRVPGIDPALYAERAPPVLKRAQRIEWDGGDGARERLRLGLIAAGLDPANLFSVREGRAPYPGLAAFEWEDAAVYFGRDREITQLQAELRLCRLPDRPRLLVVQGASGSGKSSLVRAGLLPRLGRDPHGWTLVPAFRPRREPLRFLADALRTAAAGGVAPPPPPRRPLKSPEAEAWRAGWADWVVDAAAAARRRAARIDSTALLVVDQLEEALEGPEGDAFLRVLRDALARSGPELLALATLRADFGGTLQRHPMLREPPPPWAGSRAEGKLLATGTFQLPPMAPGSIAEVVTRPAALVGLEVEQALVTRLVADTRTEDALPLLAFTLGELWEGPGKAALRLGVRDYDAFGGLEHAVGRRADAVLEGLSPGPEELAAFRAALLFRFVDISADGRAVRRPVPIGLIPAPTRRLVDAFADARLIVKGEENAEVAHEALFRTWPALAGWIEEARADLLFRRRAGEAADAWDRAGRPEGSLWRPPDLDRLADLAARNPGTLPQPAAEFLARSQAATEERGRKEQRDAEEREAALRRVAEAAEARAAAEAKARTDAEVARRRVLVGLGATAIFAALTILGAVIAVGQQREAVAQRIAALGQAVRFALAADDPFTAVRLLAGTAASGDLPPHSDEALALGFWSPLLLPLNEALAMLPPGSTFRWLGNTYLREGETGVRVMPGDRPSFAALSADGATLLLHDVRGRLRVLDRRSLVERAALNLPHFEMTGARIPPLPEPVIVHGLYGLPTMGAPDPMTLVFDRSRPGAGLVSIGAPALHAGAPMESACAMPLVRLELEAVQLSRQGDRALLVRRAGPASYHDDPTQAEANREIAVLPSDGGAPFAAWPLRAALMSPRGSHVLTVGLDEQPELLRFGAGEPSRIALPLRNVEEAVFAADEAWLAIVAEGMLHVVPLRGGYAPRRVAGDMRGAALAVDPLGRLIAALSPDGSLRVLDVVEGRVVMATHAAAAIPNLEDAIGEAQMSWLQRSSSESRHQGEVRFEVRSDAGLVMLRQARRDGVPLVLLWRVVDGGLTTFAELDAPLPSTLGPAGLRIIERDGARTVLREGPGGPVLAAIVDRAGAEVFAPAGFDALAQVAPDGPGWMVVTVRGVGTARPATRRVRVGAAPDGVRLLGRMLVFDRAEDILFVKLDDLAATAVLPQPSRWAGREADILPQADAVVLLGGDALIRQSVAPGPQAAPQRFPLPGVVRRQIDLRRFPPPLLGITSAEAEGVEASRRAREEEAWRQRCLRLSGSNTGRESHLTTLAFPALRGVLTFWEHEPTPPPGDGEHQAPAAPGPLASRLGLASPPNEDVNQARMSPENARMLERLRAALAAVGRGTEALDPRLGEILEGAHGGEEIDVPGGKVFIIHPGISLGKFGAAVIFGIPATASGLPPRSFIAHKNVDLGEDQRLDPSRRCMFVWGLERPPFQVLRLPGLEREGGEDAFPAENPALLAVRGDRLAFAESTGLIRMFRRAEAGGCAWREEGAPLALPLTGALFADGFHLRERQPGEHELEALVLGPATTLFAGGSFGIMAMDTARNRLTWRLALRDARVEHLAVSPDGRFLGVARDGGVQLLAARTGLPLSPWTALPDLLQASAPRGEGERDGAAAEPLVGAPPVIVLRGEREEGEAEPLVRAPPVLALLVDDQGTLVADLGSSGVFRRSIPETLRRPPSPADLPEMVGADAGGRPILVLPAGGRLGHDAE